MIRLLNVVLAFGLLTTLAMADTGSTPDARPGGKSTSGKRPAAIRELLKKKPGPSGEIRPLLKKANKGTAIRPLLKD